MAGCRAAFPAEKISPALRVKMLIGLAIVSLLLISFGAWAKVNNGVESRMGEDVQYILDVENGSEPDCLHAIDADIKDMRCIIGEKQQPKTIAFLGDSHADRTTKALSAQLKAKDISAIVYSDTWCVPLFDFGATTAHKNVFCRDFMKLALKEVVENPHIETVILFAQWANYTSGYRWGDKHITAYTHGDAHSVEVSNNPVMFETALLHTINMLAEANKRVILVGSTPEFKAHIRNVLAKQAMSGFAEQEVDALLTVTSDDYEKRNRDVLKSFDKAAAQFSVEYVDPHHIFCPKGSCEVKNEAGQPLYEDSNHLNLIGSRVLVEAIGAALTPP